MNTVEVVNLKTGEIIVFSHCIPSEAVIFAYLYTTNRRNTWDWPKEYLNRYSNLTWGKHTVSYDDFCAKIEPQ